MQPAPDFSAAATTSDSSNAILECRLQRIKTDVNLGSNGKPRLLSPEGSDSTPTHFPQNTQRVGSHIVPDKARLLHCGVADVDASTGRGCCQSLHASPRNRAAAPRNARPIRLRSFDFGSATNAGVDGRWRWIADRSAKGRSAPRRMTRAHDLRRITPCGGCLARVNDHAPGCTVTWRGRHTRPRSLRAWRFRCLKVRARDHVSVAPRTPAISSRSTFNPPAALHHRVNVRLVCVTVPAC